MYRQNVYVHLYKCTSIHIYISSVLGSSLARAPVLIPSHRARNVTLPPSYSTAPLPPPSVVGISAYSPSRVRRYRGLARSFAHARRARSFGGLPLAASRSAPDVARRSSLSLGAPVSLGALSPSPSFLSRISVAVCVVQSRPESASFSRALICLVASPRETLRHPPLVSPSHVARVCVYFFCASALVTVVIISLNFVLTEDSVASAKNFIFFSTNLTISCYFRRCVCELRRITSESVKSDSRLGALFERGHTISSRQIDGDPTCQ